jgi:hypothetical protein
MAFSLGARERCSPFTAKLEIFLGLHSNYSALQGARHFSPTGARTAISFCAVEQSGKLIS